MKKGLFITVEGTDGTGKTTQLEHMKEYFITQGRDVLFTREPGGTPISEKIRSIILDKKNKEMDPMTEALLYAASRAQHIAQIIKPALEHGKIVICDRFVDSSIAYQGYGRGLGETVSLINSYAIGQWLPDVTFLLKMDPSLGRERIDRGSKDRLEIEGRDFYHRVYRGYLDLEKKFPGRIIGVEADRSVEAVWEEIRGHLERIVGAEDDTR